MLKEMIKKKNLLLLVLKRLKARVKLMMRKK